MKVLVIAEHNNNLLRDTTLTTLTAAKALSDHIDVLVAGYDCQAVVMTLKQYGFINQLLIADQAIYEHHLAEPMALLIKELAENYTHILAPSTTFGKNVLPRCAALLDVGQVSDVISIIDEKTYRRPIYAGNAIATVESLDDLQVVTVRPSAFERAAKAAGDVAEVVIGYVAEEAGSHFVNADIHTGDRPELASADVVISGGRGLGDKDTFERLVQIADQMGAAIGASRAAVDGGLAPNDYQVGQTGQIVSPKLYIAIGISGAIQHLAGMKDSSIIVAINRDADAPIFEVADYGLVADIADILPAWEAYLSGPS